MNTISGADAGNYTLVQQTGLTADITPTTLDFTATLASFIAGQTPSGLSGTVSGYAAGDTLANSTTSALAWTSTATASSQPGQYPINGGGLISTNYVFAQATGNATALTLQPGTPPTNVVLTTAVLQSMLGTPNSGSGGPVSNNNTPPETLISPPPPSSSSSPASSSSPTPATTSATAPVPAPPAASIPAQPTPQQVATIAPDSSRLSAASTNLGSQRITSGQPFTVPLPDSTFVHLDTSAQVTLTISQTDGQPLPSWMTFKLQSGAFTGQAPPGVTGVVSVRVVARDQNGQQAVSIIQVVIE
ncbi:MAG: hypothetical protein HYU73_13330 [Betaproteobacteria bacterium]|nr:hypothetical protein [Betaproteobacteria bacterium]MBI3057350.1 hypothetical protein [Betaproteobacteria bacterium]